VLGLQMCTAILVPYPSLVFLIVYIFYVQHLFAYLYVCLPLSPDYHSQGRGDSAPQESCLPSAQQAVWLLATHQPGVVDG
jgi:hypothetical protein